MKGNLLLNYGEYASMQKKIHSEVQFHEHNWIIVQPLLANSFMKANNGSCFSESDITNEIGV